MQNNVGNIDTDAALGTILSNFSTEYIMHVVGDSLNMRFRPFEDPMPNMVDILQRQFTGILDHSPDFREQVIDCRNETYKEIIGIICRYYNLEFTVDFQDITDDELYGIAHLMYEIFISRFTDYMIDFFVSYIVNNSESIYAYLSTDENTKKPRDNNSAYSKLYIDSKFMTIHANINQVIYNMASYDIPLETLINYFCPPEIAVRMNSLIVDKGDIYKYYYASFITSGITSASVLTNIKLKLQSKTQENGNIQINN